MRGLEGREKVDAEKGRIKRRAIKLPDVRKVENGKELCRS